MLLGDMITMEKTVLLIGGGGTLGTYVAEELLRLGHSVDVICLEDKVSNNNKLSYIKEFATYDFLKDLFSKKRYNGIVNFLHYRKIEEYKPVHKLLSENTDHLIFLSSYRVYADKQSPITEEAPRLLDVSTDKEFVENETYAIAKAHGENFLLNESETDNWTAVRPVISFSENRFDVVTRSEREVIDKAKTGETVYLPLESKNLNAGLDWAGNSGKLIANLLFKKETFREFYTISTAQKITWDEVARLYTKIIGTKFEWVDGETYMQHYGITGNKKWMLIYDRFFDRIIDNSKVLKATGLCDKDFLSIEEGLKIELSKIGEI